MKVVSFSLFGYKNNYFDNFLHPLIIQLKAYKVLYPNWKIFINLESIAYDDNNIKQIFDELKKLNFIDFELFETNVLCRSMLWRLNPIGFADYTICRDFDSLPTYRERQSVEIWIKNGTIAHAINDEPAHTVPLMGGMIGFKKNAFDLKLVDDNYFNFDFTIKGEDQTFLEKIIYPKVQESITEHRIKGISLRHNNQYCYNYIEDINVDDVQLDDLQKIENNRLINYIGQCGWLETQNIHPYDNKERYGALDYYEKFGNKEFNIELDKIKNKYA
jgi:hypothetical protein